jgi:hypothetical protein
LSSKNSYREQKERKRARDNESERENVETIETRDNMMRELEKKTCLPAMAGPATKNGAVIERP